MPGSLPRERPAEDRVDPAGRPRTLVVACGALAREIVDLVRING